MACEWLWLSTASCLLNFIIFLCLCGNIHEQKCIQFVTQLLTYWKPLPPLSDHRISAVSFSIWFTPFVCIFIKALRCLRTPSMAFSACFCRMTFLFPTVCAKWIWIRRITDCSERCSKLYKIIDGLIKQIRFVIIFRPIQGTRYTQVKLWPNKCIVKA